MAAFLELHHHAHQREHGAEEVPGLGAIGASAALFLEVESLAPIRAAVAGLPITVPERDTFYGSRELGIREPGGHAITFAEFAKKER